MLLRRSIGVSVRRGFLASALHNSPQGISFPARLAMNRFCPSIPGLRPIGPRDTTIQHLDFELAIPERSPSSSDEYEALRALRLPTCVASANPESMPHALRLPS